MYLDGILQNLSLIIVNDLYFFVLCFIRSMRTQR